MSVSTQIRNGFSSEVTKELNNRVEWVQNGNTQWLYEKRAWSRITFTGVNQSVGDVRLPNGKKVVFSLESEGVDGGYVGGVVTRMDGRDAPRPILESVSIKNTGRGDIYNAGLYEAEFSYKVFSLSDLNTVEMAFMVPTNIVRIEFGWHPYPESKNFIEGAIAGFNFSANLDGSFSCSGKIIGGVANTPFKITEAVNQPMGDGTSTTRIVGIFDAIKEDVDRALKLTRLDDGRISNNSRAPGDGNLKYTKYKSTSDDLVEVVAVANIEVEETQEATSGDSLIRAYMSLGSLIRYFNDKFMTNSEYKYEIQATATKDPLIKSTNPSEFILRGEQGFYSENNDFGRGFDVDDNVSGLLISTELFTEIEKSMNDAEVRGEFAGGTKTLNNFLSSLFTKLKQRTGGAYDLKLYQTDPNNTEVDKVVAIVNDKMDIQIEKSSSTKEYEFETISPKSIIKSMNLSSNLDSDMMLMARSSVSSDTPYPAIERFFENYGLTILPRDKQPIQKSFSELAFPNFQVPSFFESQNISVKPNTINIDNTKKDLIESLTKQWVELGDGLTDAKVNSLTNVLKNYYNSLSKSNGDVGAPSGLVRYAIDLSIEIDGILGIQVLDSFKVDRLPNSMKSSNIHFVVTEVEHSISDGNWTTKINGGMHISI